MLPGFVKQWAQQKERQILKQDALFEFDGIVVSERRRRPSIWFGAVIARSLELIKESDGYRYFRVRTELDWIINTPLSFKGARYRCYNKSCEFDFEDPGFPFTKDYPHLDHVAIQAASVIVHEATHGKISKHLRKELSEGEKLRTEEICRSEERRFLRNVKLTFPDALIPEIPAADPQVYRRIYRTSNFEDIVRQLFRAFKSPRNSNK